MNESSNLPVQYKEASGLPVVTMSDIVTMGQFFEKSGMFGCSQEGQGFVLAMACVSERMSPIQIKQTYHIIDGNLSMRADAMLAKFNERGGKHQVIKRDENEAVVRLVKGDNDVEFRFTFEEAKKEPFVYTKDGKLKKNWATPRARMQSLWARVVSDGVRALDPGVNSGVYTPEEVDDSPSMLPSKKRTEPVAVEVLPPEDKKEQPSADVDFSVCPFGKQSGRKWITMSKAQLEAAIVIQRPEMLDGHRDEIKKALEAT